MNLIKYTPHGLLNTHNSIQMAAVYLALNSIMLHNHSLPPSFKFANVLEIRSPVEAAPLSLKPALQLLPVDLQKVCEEHFVEDLTATQDLVQCRT